MGPCTFDAATTASYVGTMLHVLSPMAYRRPACGLIVSAVLALSSGGLAWAQQTTPGRPDQPQVQEPAPAAPPGGQQPESKRPLNEKIPDNAAERARLLDNLYAHLATAGDEQSAEQAAEAIQRLWRVSGSDTVNVLMERALKAVGEKNGDLALKFLDAIVEIAPDYTEGWSQRARVLYTENEAQRAIGDLRRALALDPNHFRALDALGHILRELGEKKGALRAYEKLLEVHPFWPGAKQAIEELGREVGGQGI
jgi:tetratricopeptide (TPR) repeat protein